MNNDKRLEKLANDNIDSGLVEFAIETYQVNKAISESDVHLAKSMARLMLHMCTHDPEGWKKNIGDPDKFINAMKEQGVTL